MKRLIIDLDMRWVLAHKDADKLPASSIAELLQAQGIPVLSQSYTEVTAQLADETSSVEDLRSAIVAHLVQTFSTTEQELESLLKIRLDTVEDPDPIATKPEPTPKVTPKAVPTPKAAPAPEPVADSAMEAIRGLLGAGEFINLCEEINRMAPMLLGRGLSHILTGRSYLFSVDEGGGLTTALKLMAKLYQELGMDIVRGDPVEMKVPAENGKSDPLAEIAGQLSGARNKLVCIDISLWADKTATPDFRDFLTQLQKNNDKLVYVFRVPYLEREALNRICAAISDVLLLDTVSFIPQTHQELQKIAEKVLERYGFSVTEDAWELFHQRLAEERSDGRFYGIKTCRKVVDEIVYRKLRCVLDGIGQENVITAADLAGFVRVDSQLSAEERMAQLVGIDAIRQRLEEIVTQIEFARRNSGVRAPAMHMRFVGNPGTGKTTVARIVGQMLKERGILSKGYFFEHTGGDFLGMYVGHTAPKTLALCRDAYGSVLFIDEAYTLADASYSNGDGYAKEAIDTLIAQMENHRDDLVVIMAGYPKEMDRLMALNPGLAGRIPYELQFPNYTREELHRIFLKMVSGDRFSLSSEAEAAVKAYFENLSNAVLNDPNFSNARFVRNLFERTWSKTIMRAQLDGSDPRIITGQDFEAASREDTRTIGKKQDKRPHPGYRLGLV